MISLPIPPPPRRAAQPRVPRTRARLPTSRSLLLRARRMARPSCLTRGSCSWSRFPKEPVSRRPRLQAPLSSLTTGASSPQQPHQQYQQYQQQQRQRQRQRQRRQALRAEQRECPLLYLPPPPLRLALRVGPQSPSPQSPSPQSPSPQSLRLCRPLGPPARAMRLCPLHCLLLRQRQQRPRPQLRQLRLLLLRLRLLLLLLLLRQQSRQRLRPRLRLRLGPRLRLRLRLRQ